MKKTNLLILSILISLFSFGQIAPDKYYIQFTDKDNSPYSIANPQEFLSQRAIDRRQKFNIDITEQDLPVNPQYLSGVEAIGVDLLNPTKWFNGVTIYTSNASLVDDILALPYVSEALKMTENPNRINKSFFENEVISNDENASSLKSSNLINSLDYGFGFTQIDQLNGIGLHDDGFMGEGMLIAVLDAGFDNVDTHPLFDSLWANNQIIGVKDFVNPVNGDVFNAHYHGRAVLSCMAAYTEGQLIGTAPKADYVLLRSEDGATENIIEEYNWVSAAEMADSIGADVINSSLSYVDFDMPEWTYEYEDMNGLTAVGTIGADIAAAKGLLVVNSAGNSGSDTNFPWCGSPADGFDVFTIGAVTSTNERASFSSIGPSADGRTKPEVMSMGQGSAVADGGEGVSFGSGTSFSSPIIAGMSACLMQAYPNKSPEEIKESLMQSGSNHNSPDNFMGWGIPDYMLAYSLLTTIEILEEENSSFASVYPNPFNTDFTIKLKAEINDDLLIKLIDVNGRLLHSETISPKSSQRELKLSNKIANLNSGIYFLSISSNNFIEVKRIVKN